MSTVLNRKSEEEIRDVFYDPPKEGCNINRELERRATFVSALHNVCQRKFGTLALVVKKQKGKVITEVKLGYKSSMKA